MKRKTRIEDNISALRNLAEFAVDATSNVEETKQSLREMEVDPEKLISDVKARIKTYLDHPLGVKTEISDSNSAEKISVLGNLCEITGLSPVEIAHELGVTVPFLLDLEQHSSQAPDQWHREIARRAAKRFTGVTEEDEIEKYEHLVPVAKAASRQSSYAKSELTAEDILKRSGMSDEDQQFWRALIAEEAE